MDLDTAWIDEFNDKEKLYNGFYRTEIKDVPIVFLYINEKNELLCSKKSKLPIDKSIISKNRLLSLLKDNIFYNNRKFFPSYLLKFNITLNPEDINIFINNPQAFNFLKQVNYMQPITWDDTIEYFHPLNRLYIFMKNRAKKSQHSTKKIFISNKKRNKTRRKYI